jgi:hypothetical protein
MEININGRTYNIRNFYFDYTYSTLLAGSPNREINEDILTRIKKPYGSWAFKMHQLPITEEQMNGVLPKCYFFSDISSDPLDPEFCESGLTLFWLGNPPFDQSIPNIIEQVLTEVNWEEESKDFDF